jgi:hypothetical protein
MAERGHRRERIGHEPPGFDVRGVAVAALALAAIVGIGSAVLYLIVPGPRSAQRNAEAALHGAGSPPPRLLADPAAELLRYRREQAALLHGYGWVDREHAIARMPIDRAMQRVAAESAAAPEPIR